MKKLLSLTSFVFIFMQGITVNAQTDKTLKAAVDGPVRIMSDNSASQVKADFIYDGEYLKASGQKPGRLRLPKDSLAGFDEATLTTNLMSRGLVGSELSSTILKNKQLYINKKYFAAPVQPNVQGSGNKPIGGGGNQVNVFPCVNEDFELTPAGAYNTGNAVSGWLIESATNTGPVGIACQGAVNWVSGSPEFSVMTTPVPATPWVAGPWSIDNVTIPNSPLGGSNVVRLNDVNPNWMITKMASTFPVSNANSLFQYAYMGSWDGTTHTCCEQPLLLINMYNCNGLQLSCSSVSLNPTGPNCPGTNNFNTTNGISWTNWVVNYIDLSPFIGSCVTVEIVNADCSGGAHHGSVYFDASCSSQLAPGASAPTGTGGVISGPVSFCSGSNLATIQAPLGYASYQWYAPGTPSYAIVGNGGNTATLSINNPVAGTVYTVQLVSPSGCTFTAVDTLAFSNVNIAGTSAFSTCPGGASGSAMVYGNGSGAGYTYTWTNSLGVVVGNAQTVTGLAAGVYSIGIGALGGGCGTAGSTLQIGTAPPTTQTVVIPFCGNEAYMNVNGSQIQWYNNTTSISAVNGGTAPGFTVTSPTQGAIYRVRYLSIQNCQDSITFFLTQTPSGNMFVSNISWACPSTPNGTMQMQMTPAQGTPPGQNGFTVTSSALNYTAALVPTALTTYTAGGLSPGTYTAKSFDGACKYVTTFVVPAYVYDYTVTPQATTLCPGSGVTAGVSFSMPITPGQFQFLWTPNLFMLPNNNDISVLLTPTAALGTSAVYVYSVTVTPAIVNCPITKTISVTAVNLAIPNISQVPAFCNNAGQKNFTVSIPNGTFTALQPAPWLNGSTITPSLFPSWGVYNYTYAISAGTCYVSNVSSLDVSIFNTAALTASISNLCETAPCVNLMGIVQSQVNGVWTNTVPGVAGNQYCPANVPTGIYVLTYKTTSFPNPQLCPDSRTLAVSVSQTVAPAITAIDPFCTNKPPVQMVASPPGGVWDFQGNGNGQVISPTGLLIRANAPLGQSTVGYTIQTGACFNVAYSTIYATVFRSAALTGSIANLCVNSPNVNLNSIVVNTVSGVWSGPNVFPNTPTGFRFEPANLSTGYYTLNYNTYSAPNASVCPDSRQIVVHVLAPATPTIIQPSPHCIADAPFFVNAQPQGGYYTASQYLDPDGVFSPALAAVGFNQIVYTIGTATCNVKDTKTVSIEAFVPATITGSLADMCSTYPNINLNALVQNTSGNWTGAGVTAAAFDPATAIASMGTGAIVLTYNTSSSPSGLCPDQQSLSVNVYSLATPFITEAGPFCNSMPPVQLIASPLGGIFKGDNNNAVNPVGLFNPALSMVGDNIITYTATSGPCVAEVKTIVKIEQYIPADFLPHPDAFCRFGDPLDLNSIAQNPGGEWSGDGMIGSVFTPSLANIGYNNFVHYVTHSTTYDLCPDTSTMRILVREMPNLTVVTNKPGGCAPVEVVLNSPDASITGTGAWYLGDGSEPQTGLSVKHTFSSPGTYSVVFNYRDQIGCLGQARLIKPIEVYEIPVAEFKYGPYEEITISDPEVQFANQTTVLGSNTYEWQIGNLFKTQEVNPNVVFPAIGNYEITLIATSVYGCKDKVSHIIEIRNDFGVYIPNSFTPNEDGINDYFGPTFTPYGLDPNTFDMEIFNRWGESVYRTKDVNKGWDGSLYNKGEPMKPDVYTYKMKYKNLEGNVFTKIGHVTLVK